MGFAKTDDRVVLFEDGIRVRFGDVANEVRRLAPEADADTDAIAAWAKEHLREYDDYLRLCVTAFLTEKIAEAFAEEG